MRILIALVAAALAPLSAYAADASLDPGFGVGGMVEISWPAGSAQASAVGIDNAGRILVGGSALGPSGNDDFALFRLLPDGTLDTGYAADGNGFHLVDYGLDGIGPYSNDAVNDLVVLDDGSVIAVGEAHFGFFGVNSQVALASLDADGVRAPEFGTDGRVHFGFGEFPNIDYGYRLAVDAQGRTLVACRVAVPHNGSSALDWMAGLARLTPQGAFDATFNEGGRYSAVFWTDPTIPPPRRSEFNVPLALAMDASGRILAAGAVAQPIPMDAAILRAPPDGGYDQTFGQYARVQMGLREGNASALLPTPTGALLVAGGYCPSTDSCSMFLARRLDDGSPDVQFGAGGISTIAVADGYPDPGLIHPMHDGGWLVAGPLFQAKEWGVVITRFDAQGQPDVGFGEAGIRVITVPGEQPFVANRVAMQRDGKLVVAGRMVNNEGTARFALMRIIVDEFLFTSGFDNP